MIAFVKGTLFEKGSDHILVDTGGIGYRLHVPTRTLASLGPAGTPVLLRTSMDVREDGWTLYGFETSHEVTLFEILTSVSGIGPKTGLAVLSAHTPGEVIRGILAQDSKMFTAISGIGKKTAGRIFLDLPDKVGALGDMDLPAGLTPAAVRRSTTSVEDEAQAALQALGFEGVEVREALGEAVEALGDGATSGALVKAALQALGRARTNP